MTTREPFALRTVKPGAIVEREREVPRAPHITVTIFADGITRLVTQIFFDDEPASNAADPLLLSLPENIRERLIARTLSAAAEATVYELDIVLRGEGETPFFDDLFS